MGVAVDLRLRVVVGVRYVDRTVDRLVAREGIEGETDEGPLLDGRVGTLRDLLGRQSTVLKNVFRDSRTIRV